MARKCKHKHTVQSKFNYKNDVCVDCCRLIDRKTKQVIKLNQNFK